MKALFIISLFGFIIFALVFVVALNKDLNEKVWKRIAYISPILSAVWMHRWRCLPIRINTR